MNMVMMLKRIARRVELLRRYGIAVTCAAQAGQRRWEQNEAPSRERRLLSADKVEAGDELPGLVNAFAIMMLVMAGLFTIPAIACFVGAWMYH